MPTVQFLISHSRLINQYISALDGTGLTLDDDQKRLWGQITSESLGLTDSLHQFGDDLGSGFFPNTFVKGRNYMKVNNMTEEAQALADGWVVATFPQIMVSVGRANKTVHNAIEKDEALDQGYTLPGIAPEPPRPGSRPKPSHPIASTPAPKKK